MTSVFVDETEATVSESTTISKEIKVSSIPKHIIRYALSQNPFYYFENVSRYIPSLGTLSNFIDSQDLLANINITFKATSKRLKEITHYDYLQAISGLLKEIEEEIKANIVEYEGSDFISKRIYEVFHDKDIRVEKDDERAKGQEELVADVPWYVYNANYGTSEEKKFVALFARLIEDISLKYNDIYLIRNERELKIFDKVGRAFEPDFLLFCKQNDRDKLYYQVFIEPKAQFLIANDKWKEDFLNEIRSEEKTITINTDEFLITAVPFYNYDNENEFKTILNEILKI
jgi:type III restriction enzyme